MRKVRRNAASVLAAARAPLVEVVEPRLLLAGIMPNLAAGAYVQSGSSAMVVDSPGLSAPCIADWDRDGKKDLLVGQYANGNIWFFKNTGTDAAPAFGAGTKLKLANNTVITTSYG